MSKTEKVLLAICTFVLFLGFLGLFNTKDDTVISQEKKTEIWRDSEGKEHTKTEVFNEDLKNFLELEAKDEEIRELQEQVKNYQKQLKNGGSVTKLTTNTNIIKTVETKVIDTVKVDSMVVSYPTYINQIKDEWIEGKIIANSDSTKLDIELKNDYIVVIGEDKQGFLGLGKPKQFAEIINLNPYTSTEKVKVYYDKKDKKVKLWVYALGIGLIGGYLIGK